MISFSNNIFILGCGSIAQCSLPLLLKHIDIDPARITVMDCLNQRPRIAKELQKGVQYVQEKITPENYTTVLSKHLKKGDLFIDLSYGVCSLTLIEWCYQQDILYLNASMEVWDTAQKEETDLSRLTLYFRQQALQKSLQTRNHPGATAIIDHGANPGLVSHLTKQGLIDLGTYFLEHKSDDVRVPKIQTCIKEENFPELAYLLGLKTIHIAERDTQIAKKPKQVHEFVNTWSVVGFIEEGIAPAEMGWGAHEKIWPKGGQEHHTGPCNQIYLLQKGMQTVVQSWVPSGPITGMVIRHGEAFTISHYLTVKQEDEVLYRPTVHYVYRPCDEAVNSLHELEMGHFVSQPHHRILNDEIIAGEDELGCLLMGHDFKSWWIGSILDIEESRRLVPHQNATTVQVAISIIAAAIYMIRHPQEGLCTPDDLDYKEILEIAKPYLGTFLSIPVDWSPLDYFQEITGLQKTPKEEDRWQFTTFLLPPQISLEE